MLIAFATYAGEPGISEDDKPIAEHLKQRGITVVPEVWDDPTANWKRYDVIVLRSMWDYFLKPQAFDDWLQTLQELGCRVMNPVAVVKWNQTKKYFLDFAAKGIRIPAFRYCRQQETVSLSETMQERNWNKAVIKPAISGGSFNTWVIARPSREDEIRFAALLAERDMIVQEFMNEIVQEGEVSMIFFNKQFSHAIIKRPKADDFRVQIKYGGSSNPYMPAPEVLAQARKMLNDIEEPLLYARVDGIIRNGALYLMELELIEPVLSVEKHPHACENFFNAFCELVAKQWQISVG